jgi:hypothetical protein
MPARADGQMDLPGFLAAQDAPPPCLFDSADRGIPARQAESEAWRRAYGTFGSAHRSHAWHSLAACRVTPTGRCQGALLIADPRHRGDEPCGCVTGPDAYLYLISWAHLLVPYYGTGVARDVGDAIGTLTAKDRYALVSGAFDVEDALFRMLEPHEIDRATAFADGYLVLGSKREKTRQYDNAVTPPTAEVIGLALVECIYGELLEQAA